MKLPIGVLVARKELITRILDKEFSARTSIKLKILSLEVAKYADLYEQERVRLVKKYGTEKDTQITVEENSENWDVFVKELTEIANQQVEVNFPSLTEEEITTDIDLKISAHDLFDMEIFYEIKEVIPEVVAQ